MADIFSESAGEAPVWFHHRRRYGQHHSCAGLYCFLRQNPRHRHGLLQISRGRLPQSRALLVRLLEGRESANSRQARRSRWAANQPQTRKLGGKSFRRLRFSVQIAVPVDDCPCSCCSMTWISTVMYFQLGRSDQPPSLHRRGRPGPRHYATIDLATNSIAVLNPAVWHGALHQALRRDHRLAPSIPVIMVVAFLAVAFSPVLLVLGGGAGGTAICRMYAVAKPSRDMLFTVVEPAGQVQGKERHRYGGLPLRRSYLVMAEPCRFCRSGGWPCRYSALHRHLLAWFPIAWRLGKRYESVRDAKVAPQRLVTVGH